MNPRVWVYAHNGTCLRTIERDGDRETHVFLIAPHGVRRHERFSSPSQAAAFRQQVATLAVSRGFRLLWSSPDA